MKKVANPYTTDFDKLAPLYEAQKSKVYDFKESDFSIDLLTNKWKHKSWKTWMKGGNDYSETKEIINRYIAECAKPYGTRNLDFVHSYAYENN